MYGDGEYEKIADMVIWCYQEALDCVLHMFQDQKSLKGQEHFGVALQHSENMLLPSLTERDY